MKLLLTLILLFNRPGELTQSCRVLQQAYPGTVTSCSTGQVLLSNGRVIPFFKGPKKRSIEQMMNRPDLASAFILKYPYQSKKRVDAGRVRLYVLFNLVYGKNKRAIRRNLVQLSFMGKKIWFNKKNGAIKALKKIEIELKKLLKHHPKLKPYFKEIQTFNYRRISGTKLLSSHSYGTALDLTPRTGHYWKWNRNWKKVKTISYPMKIVKIFEKFGFIWGGRWKHYDSMHFEYRPEFLLYAKKYANNR